MGLKKIVRNALISLAFGFKNTESNMFKQKTTSSESNSLEQQQTSNQLAEALLRGEVTEEVELLRDRMYYVSEEAKKIDVTFTNIIVDHETGDVTGDLKTGLKSMIVGKPKVFEDDYKMIISMETPMITNNVLDTMNAISGAELEKVESALKFTYDCNEKYKLHRYIRRIAIRKKEDDYILDFYIPNVYAKVENFESAFVAELKKVKEKKLKPINLEFETVQFIADDAYGVEDLNEFKFEMIKFKGINEFNDFNVISYYVKPLIYQFKVTDKYIKQELRDKYARKERRNVKLTASFSDGL